MRHRSNCTRFHKPIHGFTLIELLVVIAVIALLLSVIMPALGKAKKLAKSMVCKTNLRSLQLGNIMYTQDNDGKHLTGDFDRLWTDEIAVYIEDMDEARFCPEAIERNFEPDQTVNISPYINGYWNKPWGFWQENQGRYGLGSYSINNAMYGLITWGGKPVQPENSYLKAGMVQNAGIVPVFMDGIRFGVGADNDPPGFNPLPLSRGGHIDWKGGGDELVKTNQNMSRVLINRHAGNGNIAYYDGHVEQVYLPEYFLQKWHRASTPNQAIVDRIIAENPPSKSR